MRLNSSDNKIIPKIWPFHNLTTCILTLTVKVKERPQLVTASFNKSVMYTKIRFTTSVSCSASKKNRLILDLSVLNKFIPKTRFKLDDWKSGIQFLSQNALMVTFDLKSGYHHFDIAPASQCYLGFSWSINGVVRHFEFTVLPFGLKSAPYIFTKALKPLVTHWRSCGVLIALYLDDGFIVIPRPKESSKHNQIALNISNHIRSDLLEAGFVYNISKSIWSPVNTIDWLGMRCDTAQGTLKILDRRIVKINKSMPPLIFFYSNIHLSQ